MRSCDRAPARRVCGLPERAWAAGAQVGPPGRALPSHGSPRHLSPHASPSRPAVWVCFHRSQWPGIGGGIWPLSVILFLFRGPCSKSGPISSKPQVTFNFMPPGENPPRAEEPCLGAAQDLQARGARSPGCSSLPTPGRPSPLREDSGAGSRRSAALPVTTRGHTWCSLSWAPGGAVRATRGCPMPAALPGGLEPPPLRGPGPLQQPLPTVGTAAASVVMSPPPAASSSPGRGRALSPHSRCLLMPAARSANHRCPLSLGSWVQAPQLGLGKHTCWVPLEGHLSVLTIALPGRTQ